MKKLLGCLIVFSFVTSCNTLKKDDNSKKPNEEIVEQNIEATPPSNALEAFPQENLTEPSIEVMNAQNENGEVIDENELIANVIRENELIAAADAFDHNEIINVSFEQNGRLIPSLNGIITLTKAPFDVIFNLPKPMAVLVNASFDDKLLRIASEGESLASRREFSLGYMIAQGLFNPEKVLYVSEEASNPYFYKNEEKHNFSTIEVENGNYKCTRRIENIADIDVETSVKVENIDAPIYLVFVPDSNDENPIDDIKIQTAYLTIKWREKEQHPIINTDSFEPDELSHLDISAKELSLINSAIKQLDLEKARIHSDFIVTKVRPDNTKETILVIPEYEVLKEDFFLLNSYILIVNSETGKIINQYFENSSWQSDALMLSEITIDTAPYNVSENNRAFGIRARYRTLSQPNPYSNTTLSLFVKSENTLKEILRGYEVMDFSGRWDSRCDGESTSHNKTLIMKTDKTNGYFDILVNDEITDTSTFMGADDECNSTEVLSTKKTVLKFNGEEYTENGK